MNRSKIVIGGLAATGVVLVPSSLSAQYSPVAPFRGKIFKATIDVDRKEKKKK